MITTNGQLYQWDIGRIVEVHHLKSSTVSEIHIFNGTTDSALVLELSEIDGKTVAKIPDELLQHDYNVDIYAVVRDKLGKYTTEHLNTKVLSRPKPLDYVYTPSEVKTFEALEKRIKEIEEKGVSQEVIKNTIQEYLRENGLNQSRISVVTVFASKWVKVTDDRYAQVVHIEGVTKNSLVDLSPSGEQLEIFCKEKLTFVAENEDGIITVVVVGENKPTEDYTMQVNITEVSL